MAASCCADATVSTVQSLLPLAILGASLAGSVHCVGMCGGLVVACSNSKYGMAVYHVGRLLGYMGLGFFSGYIGQRMVSYTWVPLVMGLMFIVLGLFSMTGKFHVNIPFATHILNQVTKLKSRVSPTLFSGIVGLMSIFLPCGWLYAFVFAVSQAKHPLVASFLMGVFWLGTLPALTISPYLFKRFVGLSSQRVAACIFIGVGLVTLMYR